MKMLCIYTTFASLKDAKRVCRILLKDKVIVCANILSSGVSLYSFEGKNCEEREYVVFLKSTMSKERVLIKKLLQLHPYKVPTVARMEMTQKNKKYIQWMLETLK